jgi:hypothetical protein
MKATIFSDLSCFRLPVYYYEKILLQIAYFSMNTYWQPWQVSSLKELLFKAVISWFYSYWIVLWVLNWSLYRAQYIHPSFAFIWCLVESNRKHSSHVWLRWNYNQTTVYCTIKPQSQIWKTCNHPKQELNIQHVFSK